MTIFCRPHGYLHLRHQKRGDRAIGPYNYVSSGETSEKVGCSIGSAWVGAVAGFDERGHGEVWERSKGEWLGTRSVFLWGPGFPVLNRRTARRVSSLIWVVLGKETSCCRGKLSSAEKRRTPS